MGRLRNRLFWAKVDLPEGCWVWRGATKGITDARTSYGNFWTGERTEVASRYAYMMFFGAIPEGRQVNHSCNNGMCVNPMHLYAGTPSENNYDRVDLGLNTGEAHWNAKLTEDDVRAIRAEPKRGAFIKRLADHYGVSMGTIDKIRRRETWKHVVQSLTVQSASDS